MRKICIICAYDYPIPTVKGGAVEQVVESLCKENEKKPSAEITVLSTFDAEAESVGKGYKHTNFIYFKKSGWDNLFYFNYRVFRKLFHIYLPSRPRMIELRKWIVTHESEFDAIVFEDGLTPMAHYLLAGIDRKKVFSHMHWPGLPDKNTQYYIGHLMPVSEYAGKEFLKNCGNEPAVTMDVLKNGIDITRFSKKMTEEEKKKLREELGISGDAFVILYVGRIIPEKGILELINSINMIRDRKISLVIAGAAKFGVESKTKYESEVAGAISESVHQVIQLGFVKNQEIYKYQNIADCAVSPSIIKEAAPLVNLEHMAAGLPLVTTNQGGTPEYAFGPGVIRVNVDDELCNALKEAIVFLYDNPKERIRMSGEAAKTAREFTSANVFEGLLRILSKY